MVTQLQRHDCFDMTYLSEEPVHFEWPESWESVEEQGVGVRSVVTSKEAHVCKVLEKRLFINYY